MDWAEMQAALGWSDARTAAEISKCGRPISPDTVRGWRRGRDEVPPVVKAWMQDCVDAVEEALRRVGPPPADWG